MNAAGLFLLVTLLLLLAIGVPIGLALMGTSFAAITLYSSSDALALLGGDVWRSLTTPELVSLPLFILLGSLIARSDLAEEVFAALEPMFERLPGRLLHANVVAATLFAAVTGSSAATTATVGRITVPRLLARGYPRDLVLGSLCGAGTLGFLIPPSIVLIVYGVVTQVSIVDLFLAGILPGLLYAGLAMAWIAFASSYRPQPQISPNDRDRTRGRERRSLRPLCDLSLLIGGVIGAMAAGVAGPSEAATIGIALTLLVRGPRLARRPRDLIAALGEATRTSAMLALILLGALFFAKAVALFGLADTLANFLLALAPSPFVLFLILLVAHVLAGMWLDGLSLILISVPVSLPLARAAGFDPLWYGIFLVITVEMAQITPPVGFNLFIVRELADSSLGQTARAALPFFSLLALVALLLYVLPVLALWPA